jgi:hypothetical protein
VTASQVACARYVPGDNHNRLPPQNLAAWAVYVKRKPWRFLRCAPRRNQRLPGQGFFFGGC